VTQAAADAGLRAWLGRRVPVWQEVEGRLARLSRGKRHDFADANGLVDDYRLLARDLSMARRLMPESRVARFLESAYRRAHGVLARPAYSLLADLKLLLVEDVPALTRELAPGIGAIAALLVLSGLAGAWLVWTFPELVALLLPEQTIRAVEGGRLWTESILNVVPSSILSTGIISNNITVSLAAYCVGVIFGLGTFYIIATNGLMIGGLYAFTAQHQLGFGLFEFTAAHGPVELTAICLAGAAGVALGDSLVRPRERSRAESFRLAVGRTSRYLIFVAILLVGCGLIEGYVSADSGYPFASRAVIGIASWVIAACAATGLLYRGRSAAAPRQIRRRARIRS
jgi:uncharacterized membrane protein SpoIIM required for sporulation